MFEYIHTYVGTPCKTVAKFDDGTRIAILHPSNLKDNELKRWLFMAKQWDEQNDRT
jgi:hypothetical protein